MSEGTIDNRSALVQKTDELHSGKLSNAACLETLDFYKRNADPTYDMPLSFKLLRSSWDYNLYVVRRP